MKFVRSKLNHLVFQLGRREHQLLVDLLQLYPLIPTRHHRLSRTADPHAVQADQQLLEEAKELGTLMRGSGRFEFDDELPASTYREKEPEWKRKWRKDRP